MPPVGARDSISPAWSCCVFDFASPQPGEEPRRAPRIGVEREMQIMYQQPHLVPPMKLTVYDDLPPTPAQLPLSRVATWASRASGRASLSGLRRASKRRSASAPVALEAADEVVRRRRRSFRPLELSIYLPDNRLSDLPEFDTDEVTFTSLGEISLPPRALLRTKSEIGLWARESPSPPRQPVSMFHEPTYQHRRQDVASTVISTSRPPSEYDALHSHPVSWNSLPGLPPPCHHRDLALSVSILSPMQEEMTPVCTPACVSINGTVLEFPKPPPTPVDGDSFITAEEQITSSAPAIFKLSQPPASSSTRSLPLRASLQNSSEHSASSKYNRISQWLGHSHSTSSLTTSTSRSFAEHRRKRSDFYQCRLPSTPPAQVQPTAQQDSPRVPSRSCPTHVNSHSHERQRTLSASTLASTVDTAIMSLDDTNSTYSATTVPTVQTRSRSATVKSFSKPIVVVQEIPAPKKAPATISGLPPAYVDVDSMYVPELNRPLRSPGVGIAF